LPRSSSCSPWITGDDVLSSLAIQSAVASINATLTQAIPPLSPISDEIVAVICAEAAQSATEILYERTAHRFTGNCGPVTIRPVSRPVNADVRAWTSAGWGSWGYGWGASLVNNLGEPPVMSLYAEDTAPYIELYDYPVTEIVEVKIDGTVIPADEYELRENKWLIRMLPYQGAKATARWGWPVSQTQYFPDTQEGTFSVTYMFGQDCGSGGRMACKSLAENLAIPFLGDMNAYPDRVTTITRQGVTAQIASVVDVMSKGGPTGLRTVDMWLRSVNPNGLMKKPLVFSPDTARNQRQQFPSPT